jgi:hypothetical protein
VHHIKHQFVGGHVLGDPAEKVVVPLVPASDHAGVVVQQLRCSQARQVPAAVGLAEIELNQVAMVDVCCADVPSAGPHCILPIRLWS